MTKTMAQLLRVACKANKLGESGSSTVLLKRLLAAGEKKDAMAKKSTAKKSAAADKSTSKNVKKTASTTKKAVPLFKKTKSGGKRLSAAAYFKQVAGGKLYNCAPQWVCDANGKRVLKKIKMCDDAWGGRCVKWVNA
jgi:negative regulator of replication initiation